MCSQKKFKYNKNTLFAANDYGFEKLVIVIGKRLGDKKMLAETPEHKVSGFLSSVTY